MSLFFKREASLSSLLQQAGQPVRSDGRPIQRVDSEKALRAGAMWACRRLRADLVSTMPLDVYRTVDGVDMEQVKPPIFNTPGGPDVDWCEWAYSSQFELDNGNAIGVIAAVDPRGLPTRIDLAPMSEVQVRGRGREVTRYLINGERYDPARIWHERQFTVPGLAVGLSPIAYAAMSLGGYLSAQEFAFDWFAGGGIPSARLKNTAKVITPQEAEAVKARFRATVGTGDLFVTGADWEYDTIQAKASESAFIDQMKFSVTDICRFMGVPADMIDAAPDGTGSITYANITQRNLQFLIMNLNPVLRRREALFSRRLLPQPRFAKFNRGALLEMDLTSRYAAHATAISSGFLTVDEVRELENRPPLEDATTPAAPTEDDTMPERMLRLVEAMATREAVQVHQHAASHELRVERVDASTTVVERQPVTVVNEIPASEVRVEVEAPAPAAVTVVNEVPVPEVTVLNDVRPSEVVVMPSEPRTRRVERDSRGEIIAVHEE